MSETLQIRVTIDQDGLAYAAENGVDAETLLAAVRASITEAYPAARVRVATTTSFGQTEVIATDAEGDETWTREVDDAEHALPDLINRGYERAFDATEQA